MNVIRKAKRAAAAALLLGLPGCVIGSVLELGWLYLAAYWTAWVSGLLLPSFWVMGKALEEMQQEESRRQDELRRLKSEVVQMKTRMEALAEQAEKDSSGEKP